MRRAEYGVPATTGAGPDPVPVAASPRPAVRDPNPDAAVIA